MKLLYAEDEPAMAEAVTDILEYHNFSVDTVYNGADALAYARSLIDDSSLREEALENAARWTAGKPKDLISEYKMFGD